jgi:hypothetical protein
LERARNERGGTEITGDGYPADRDRGRFARPTNGGGAERSPGRLPRRAHTMVHEESPATGSRRIVVAGASRARRTAAAPRGVTVGPRGGAGLPRTPAQERWRCVVCYGVRAKRSKAGAVSFEMIEAEAGHAPVE